MKRKNKGLLFLILPTWIVLAVVFGYYYTECSALLEDGREIEIMKNGNFVFKGL